MMKARVDEYLNYLTELNDARRTADAQRCHAFSEAADRINNQEDAKRTAVVDARKKLEHEVRQIQLMQIREKSELSSSRFLIIRVC